ncbi:hypothetical protein CAAN1_03S04940 [[Candida] anglica]|uniref:Spindle pole body-associated protein Vik1/Cik1 microtubule binding domain-containing protein n=1 Tax=[Candida] anglica TaxID=148631 RepID=A0ABP0EJX2_9ASCO
MSSNHISKDGTPINKRVLEEIQNTTGNKRKSLGFEMVKIDDTSIVGLNDSFIPPKRVYSLPKGATKSSIPTSIDLDLQHIKKLSYINQNLKKMAHGSNQTKNNLNTSIPHNSNNNSTLRSRMNKVEDTYNKDILNLTETQRDLDSRFKEMSSKADSLERELIDVKRSLKKVNHQISETKIHINSSHKRFEYMESTVMKNVLNKEKLVNIQIEQLSKELDGKYQEVTYQVEGELKNAKSYKDKTVMEEINKLQRQKEQLEQQLEETKGRKIQTLKGEAQDLEKELDKFLKNKSSESKKLSTKFQEQQEKLHQMEKELSKLNHIKQKKQDEVDNLEKGIIRMQTLLDNVSSVRADLLSKKTKLEIAITELKQRDNSLNTKLEETQLVYQNSLERFQREEDHRKFLENSIWNHEGKLRVYILVDMDNQVNFDENCISIGSKKYEFNKVLNMNQETNSSIFGEYSSMIDSVAYGINCSILLSGEKFKNGGLLRDSTIQTFQLLEERCKTVSSDKNWRFQFQYSYIAVNGTACLDLLNNENSVETNNEGSWEDLHCKTTTIMTKDDIKLHNYDGVVVSILTMDAINEKSLKCFKSTIVHMDISSLTLDQQSAYLKEVDTPSSSQSIGRFLSTCFKYSTFLNISRLHSINNDNVSDFINVCETLKAKNSPYMGRNLLV